MTRVAEYLLDEGSGTTVNDNVGTNDGTFDSNVSWISPGPPTLTPSPHAITIASPGHVDLPPVLTLGPSSQFTITCWVRRSTSHSGREAALGLSVFSGNFEVCLGTGFGSGSTGKFSVDIVKAYSDYQNTVASSNYELDTWYHLAAKGEGTQKIVEDVQNNGSGGIRIVSTNHELVDGQSVYIKDCEGATCANGVFTVQYIDQDNFNLTTGFYDNSTYTGNGKIIHGKISLYVDGIFQSTTLYNTTTLTSTDNANDWSIGSEKDFEADPDNDYAYQWIGDIGKITVDDVALSDSEIEALATKAPDNSSIDLYQEVSTIAEGTTQAVYALASITKATDIVVDLAFSGTAVNNTHYTRSSTSILIASGETSGSISIMRLDNNIYETNKSVIVDIDTITGGNENGTQQLTYTLTNDEAQPTIDLSLSANTVSENNTVVYVTATLNRQSEQTIDMSVKMEGTATSNTDYTLSTNSLTFAPLATSASFSITTINDGVYESDETALVKFATVSNASTGSTVALTITNNPNYVTISCDQIQINETGGVAYVVATLQRTSSQNVTVNFAFAGTATDPDDYTKSSNSLIISSGSTSGSISIQAIQDVISDSDENIVVSIDSVNNANLTASSVSILIHEIPDITPVTQLVGLKLGLGL